MTRFIVLAIILSIFSACSRSTTSTSVVSFRIPSAAELNRAAVQKISQANLDWSKACFMVNVTGSGINSANSGKCDVPSGIFSGSVAPGEKLTLEIARGAARKFEVFAYFRSSSAMSCIGHDTLNAFDPGSVASVGATVADVVDDKQDVEVKISMPSTSSSLVTQFNLPAFCAAGFAPLGDGSSRVVNARGYGSSTHFKVYSVVTGLPTGPAVRTASGLRIRFSHDMKEKDAQ